MLNFKKIELEDKEWIDECLKQADYRGCEYSFGCNYIWRNIYHIMGCKVNGFYCTFAGEEGSKYYNYPAGSGDMKEVISLLMEDAKERNIPFVLRGMTKEQVSTLEELFPDTFDFELKRDESDYIYAVDKMTSLAGKKLHGKRNHIARFKDCKDWEYVQINEDNIHECIEMNKKWCSHYDCHTKPGLKEEMCAVDQAIIHFKELGFVGGFIRREGEVVAYSIGEPLSSDTFVVHIEKAFHDIQGAYPIINQQFIEHNCQDFTYVNREEDTGNEGLRKAKLSYYPEIILDKYKATLK